MDFSTALILIAFAWMLGSQWGRIRTEHKEALKRERCLKAAMDGLIHKGTPRRARLHPDQDCVDPLPPYHNPWKAFEVARERHFRPKTWKVYRPWRSPRDVDIRGRVIN